MSGDRVLAGLEVEATLGMGSEHLFLLFTQTSLLLAHIVKVGRVSATLSLLLGRMSDGFKRVPPKAETLHKISELPPEEILRMDPENFELRYDSLISMTAEPGDRGRSKITLLTTDQKIQLYGSAVAVDGVRELVVSLLGDRAQFKL